MVASLLAAQGFVLLAQGSSGAAPTLITLLDAFTLRPLAQLSIVLTGLIPFVVGLVYLRHLAGGSAVKFFFGNILVAAPPDVRHFERFKCVMQITAVPFTFVAPVVVLGGVLDHTALSHGVALGLRNWPLLVLLLAMSLFFEWGSARATSVLPKKYAIAAMTVLLVITVAWTFAFSFTLYEALTHTESRSIA